MFATDDVLPLFTLRRQAQFAKKLKTAHNETPNQPEFFTLK